MLSFFRGPLQYSLFTTRVVYHYISPRLFLLTYSYMFSASLSYFFAFFRVWGLYLNLNIDENLLYGLLHEKRKGKKKARRKGGRDGWMVTEAEREERK